MDRSYKSISAIGIVAFSLFVLLLLWDWNRYWLPAPIEAKLFFPENSWISIPEEGSLADRIASLRAWKDTRAIHKEERAANAQRWQYLEAFSFAGEFLSCENALKGRWFLHFDADGKVRTAVPGDMRFAKDNQDPKFPVVDLADIFAEPTSYRRLDGRTIEFTNPSGTRHFSMTPILEEVDGDLSPWIIPNCCNRIVFESLDEPEIRFELWRDEANASKFEFYRKQRNP